MTSGNLADSGERQHSPGKPRAETALDDALGLQMISVRLSKSLIEDLKFCATANGVGYQPMIRDVLSRWARGEKNTIIRQRAEFEKQQAKAAAKPEARKVA
jgi:uncharacterized protein (DUF4415 family)